MENTPVISVESLRKVYKYHRREAGLKGAVRSFFHRRVLENIAVKDISFTVNSGEFVGFIGPNGAGKTTTLKMLSGVLYPTSGEATVLGYIPHHRKSSYLKEIAFIMGQKASLFWELPAMELFLLQRDIYEVPAPQFKKNLETLTTMLDAKGFMDIQVRKLSLGQRMKCELIAGLLHMPKVLFLDEPTIGLDVVSQYMFRDFFKKYNKETGATILLTSHYLEDIHTLCERIIFIDQGIIIYDGPLTELIYRYADYVNLSITFSDPVTDDVMDLLNKFGKPERDGSPYKILLHVSRKDSPLAAKDILNKYSVSNLFIEESSLQEIVSRMMNYENHE